MGAGFVNVEVLFVGMAIGRQMFCKGFIFLGRFLEEVVCFQGFRVQYGNSDILMVLSFGWFSFRMQYYFGIFFFQDFLGEQWLYYLSVLGFFIVNSRNQCLFIQIVKGFIKGYWVVYRVFWRFREFGGCVVRIID